MTAAALPQTRHGHSAWRAWNTDSSNSAARISWNRIDRAAPCCGQPSLEAAHKKVDAAPTSRLHTVASTRNVSKHLRLLSADRDLRLPAAARARQPPVAILTRSTLGRRLRP